MFQQFCGEEEGQIRFLRAFLVEFGLRIMHGEDKYKVQTFRFLSQNVKIGKDWQSGIILHKVVHIPESTQIWWNSMIKIVFYFGVWVVVFNFNFYFGFGGFKGKVGLSDFMWVFTMFFLFLWHQYVFGCVFWMERKACNVVFLFLKGELPFLTTQTKRRNPYRLFPLPIVQFCVFSTERKILKRHCFSS